MVRSGCKTSQETGFLQNIEPLRDSRIGLGSFEKVGACTGAEKSKIFSDMNWSVNRTDGLMLVVLVFMAASSER